MRILLLSFLLACGTVQAYPLEEIKLIPEDVVSIYDGDTLTVQIPYLPDVFGDRLSVRVNGIDTPEMRSDCATKAERDAEKILAIKARDAVGEMIANGKRVTLTNLDRDKYFRLLATVVVDGRVVGDELIARGLAVPYSGGTKVGWCGL
jgi:endonuclease YncB( thermonuclease family)